MKKKYRIKEILHSGRRGIRNEPCTDEKYDDIRGRIGWVDIDEIKQFERYRIDLVSDDKFDWWTISEVFELGVNRNTGDIQIETANSIYMLEALDNGEED